MSEHANEALARALADLCQVIGQYRVDDYVLPDNRSLIDTLDRVIYLLQNRMDALDQIRDTYSMARATCIKAVITLRAQAIRQEKAKDSTLC